MTAAKRIPNLDGLRFIAAAVVAVCHFDILKYYYGLERTGWRFFNNSGPIAVTFFFVLSGFLITYLLLKEKLAHTEGRISISRFYLRRIKRIWPLYYLLVLLTFFVFNELPLVSQYPGNQTAIENGLSMKRFAGYLFFLPNYTEYAYGREFYLSQTWSLGVEEFFYLFFPVGLYFVSRRNVVKYLSIVAIIFLVLSTAIHFFNHSATASAEAKKILFIFFDKYRIYSFALGGLAAWLLFQDTLFYNKRLALLQKKQTAVALLLLLTGLVLAGITFSFLTQQVYSLLIAFFLYTIVSSNIRFSLLNSRKMVYLGKISYGIYMFHPLGIIIVLNVVRKIHHFSITGEIAALVISLLLTVLIAAISFEMFEKYFLSKKEPGNLITE